MKVKQVRFTPLGRPPVKGEWQRTKLDPSREIGEFHVCDGTGKYYEAFRREEVEVDVPDPAPRAKWIEEALRRHGPDGWITNGDLVADLSAAYAKLVEERGAMLAEQFYQTDTNRKWMVQRVREVFLGEKP